MTQSLPISRGAGGGGEPFTFLSLFSGIGGIDLGLERAGMRCVGQVEIDPYCRKVLAKHWTDVPRFDDVRTFKKDCINERIDLIAGGFPCQDISNAGKRAGIDGERSGLWSEFYRIICEIRPRFILVENVAALLIRGLDRVLGDLAASGYDAEWDCIPAVAVGAPHRRDRLWIVAHSSGERTGNIGRQDCGQGRESASASQSAPLRQVHGAAGSGRPIASGEATSNTSSQRWNAWGGGKQNQEGQGSGWGESRACSEDAADAAMLQRPSIERNEPDGIGQRNGKLSHPVFEGLEGHECGVVALADYRRSNTDPARSGWWAAEPSVGRMAHGIPNRVDRLKGLGNAVVPQVVEWIGRRILESQGVGT